MCRISDRVARARAGFSLIEILIVIAIIATLAAMILFGASALGIGSKKAKTATILAAVRKGIELTIASKGGSISPVEHPFAGSKKPVGANGFKFRGWRGRPLPPAVAASANYNTDILPGASTVGAYTLKGAEEWWITANKSQIYMDDDVFDDPRAPGLVGMPRGYMGVIGSQQYYVTEYWRVTRPSNGTAIAAPYSVGSDAISHVWFDPAKQQGLPQENQKAIDYLFGSSGVQSELSSLNALFETPTDPNYPAPNNDGTLLFGTSPNGLVWSQDQAHTGWTGTGELQMKSFGHWEAGLVSDNPAGGSWYRYKLRGLGIYDAWGREIFYSYGSGGGIRLLSLGADGCYKYELGENRVLDTSIDTATDPSSVAPASGDKDGSRDNVVQDVAE